MLKLLDVALRAGPVSVALNQMQAVKLPAALMKHVDKERVQAEVRAPPCRRRGPARAAHSSSAPSTK